MSRRSKPATERIFSNATPRCRGFLQRRDDLALPKDLVAVAVGLHEAECGLQVRRRKSDRRRGDGAGREKFFRDQDRAAIEFGEVFRIKQPRLEFALEAGVGKNPLAIDLVLQRRFLEHTASAR